MKLHLTSFPDFELHINAIKPKPGTETFIHNEFLAYIQMQKEDDSTSWDNPTSLINNICDECHDGAYTPDETTEPFNDYDLQEFMKKYDLFKDADPDMDIFLPNGELKEPALSDERMAEIFGGGETAAGDNKYISNKLTDTQKHAIENMQYLTNVDFVPEDWAIYNSLPEPYRTEALELWEDRKNNWNNMVANKLKSFE